MDFFHWILKGVSADADPHYQKLYGRVTDVLTGSDFVCIGGRNLKINFEKMLKFFFVRLKNLERFTNLRVILAQGPC